MGPNGLQGRPQGGPKRAPRLDETLIFEYCLCVVHPSLFSCVFKKTRLASTRRSFWASLWARNLSWGAPDATSFSSWVPRRAQEAPKLPPRHVQSQKRRLASTRRSFFSKMSVSSRRGSFFLFPGLPPRRAQAQTRRLDETLSLDIEKTCPPHSRSYALSSWTSAIQFSLRPRTVAGKPKATGSMKYH